LGARRRNIAWQIGQSLPAFQLLRWATEFPQWTRSGSGPGLIPTPPLFRPEKTRAFLPRPVTMSIFSFCAVSDLESDARKVS
jgi:hypothetical protein